MLLPPAASSMGVRLKKCRLFFKLEPFDRCEHDRRIMMIELCGCSGDNGDSGEDGDDYFDNTLSSQSFCQFSW